MIPCNAFYREYHGHRPDHLDALHKSIRGQRSVVWLLGDSTLDNKHWIDTTEPAVNGYEQIIAPPQSTPDVAHHLNREIVERGLGGHLCAINTAVEEATLGARHASSPLLPQDAFCRDHLQAKDVLIVSCGGNDIALRPTALTGVSIVTLLSCPEWLIRHAGSSPLLYRLVPGLSHFVNLFGTAAMQFVERVCEKQRPRVLVLCMLYYLDEAESGSWADGTLKFLGYNTNPAKLQLVMRIIYERAICQMQMEGVQVVPVPLYKALDGKDTADYVARVEPSSQGGRKMAKLLMDSLLAAVPEL